jgi:hypothetical protein
VVFGRHSMASAAVSVLNPYASLTWPLFLVCRPSVAAPVHPPAGIEIASLASSSWGQGPATSLICRSFQSFIIGSKWARFKGRFAQRCSFTFLHAGAGSGRDRQPA